MTFKRKEKQSVTAYQGDNASDSYEKERSMSLIELIVRGCARFRPKWSTTSETPGILCLENSSGHYRALIIPMELTPSMPKAFKNGEGNPKEGGRL